MHRHMRTIKITLIFTQNEECVSNTFRRVEEQFYLTSRSSNKRVTLHLRYIIYKILMIQLQNCIYSSDPALYFLILHAIYNGVAISPIHNVMPIASFSAKGIRTLGGTPSNVLHWLSVTFTNFGDLATTRWIANIFTFYLTIIRLILYEQCSSLTALRFSDLVEYRSVSKHRVFTSRTSFDSITRQSSYQFRGSLL